MNDLTGKAGSLGRLAGQSVAYAFRQLGNDRFRTVLSLLGVSIGVFCVSASTSVVNSLQKSMRDGLQEFGTDAVFIEKIPLEPDLDESGTFRWWKYAFRPEPDIGDCHFLESSCSLAESISFSSQYDGGRILGVSEIWRPVVRNGIAEGREFTINELLSGAAVAILGSDVKNDNEDYIGIGGRKAKVIGRFESSGINSVSLTDIDKTVIVPFRWIQGVTELEAEKSTITVIPLKEGNTGMFLGELERNMRRSRSLSPNDENDFAINRLSFILDEMNGLFETISSIGWITGIFSLIIGAFGIANVMFVSVKERTREIGLQKAIGAKKEIIILQYLTESTTLSVIGGIFGLISTQILLSIVPEKIIEISIDSATAFAGIIVSVTIGLISGIVPAIEAASMQPAEALHK